MFSFSLTFLLLFGFRGWLFGGFPGGWWGFLLLFCFVFCIAPPRLEGQDKLHFLPIIFLLEYPLHQHFPQAKSMLRQFFRHNKQSQRCHLVAESIELAGEDITSRCLPHAHHSLESTCSFPLFNKGSLGLWIDCHLQYPLEQCVLRICCEIHYIMEIFLIWWSVVPGKKSQ